MQISNENKNYSISGSEISSNATRKFNILTRFTVKETNARNWTTGETFPITFPTSTIDPRCQHDFVFLSLLPRYRKHVQKRNEQVFFVKLKPFSCLLKDTFELLREPG